MRRALVIGCALIALVVGTGALPAQSQETVSPGEVVEEAPTVTCLGVRWSVRGDDNRNAEVSVSYRVQGEKDWKKALPLFRLDPKSTPGLPRFAARVPSMKVPNMFAGTIFNLRPGTTYEVKLSMTDPDGGDGEKTLTMRTRPVPRAAPDARVRTCRPTKLQETFNSALPGDVLVVSTGAFAGTLDVRSRKGSRDRPIVIRAAKGATVTLDGQEAAVVVNASDSRYIHLEGLVIRNARTGVVANGAVGLVVRRCRIEKVKQAINNGNTRQPGKDFYIADSVMIGPYTWPKAAILSSEGIQLCGTGHVVCHNRIRGWSDGIGIVDGRGDYPASAIDFYNNDISECTDDAIELDTGRHNIRAFGNRITDCGSSGISCQPVYGGPAYIVRNVIYNVGGPQFKLHNYASGIVIYHNTTVRTGRKMKGTALAHCTNGFIHNAVFRNNLFLGSGGPAMQTWGGMFFGSALDYNGYTDGPFRLPAGKSKFRPNPEGAKALAPINVPNLAAFVKTSRMETHGVTVTLNVFADRVKFPVDDERHWPPPDLRLKAGSQAVDAGVVLPGINDGYKGKAPDIGACELGQALPAYGPRPQGVDEGQKEAN